jgi:protocatechuate 3,4-dioxygenase beta subunit
MAEHDSDRHERHFTRRQTLGKPIHSAAVDIWHCDAGGLYSDESSNGTAGQTFLRGVQLTNKKCYATYKTVYPGHYTGRATHST